MVSSTRRRLIVGISGATSIVFGVPLLEALRGIEVETHLVVSGAADMTRDYETVELSSAELRALASHTHKISDVGASIASGSFRTMGMIVAPCSVRTVADIAYGTTGNLLTRAADVVLKERRRLVLMVRESPLSLVHLRRWSLPRRRVRSSRLWCPHSTRFYTRPQSIADIIDHIVGRALDLFDLDAGLVSRWEGTGASGSPPSSDER